MDFRFRFFRKKLQKRRIEREAYIHTHIYIYLPNARINTGRQRHCGGGEGGRASKQGVSIEG